MAPGARHVLIVEDSEIVSGALTVLFEQTGKRVSVAPTVASAIESGTADPADVVLLDLTLPDGDGLQVAPRLLSLPHPPVVIALTGHDDPVTVKRCTDAGCAAVLLKPVPARELLRRVDEFLGSTAE